MKRKHLRAELHRLRHALRLAVDTIEDSEDVSVPQACYEALGYRIEPAVPSGEPPKPIALSKLLPGTKVPGFVGRAVFSAMPVTEEDEKRIEALFDAHESELRLPIPDVPPGPSVDLPLEDK